MDKLKIIDYIKSNGGVRIPQLQTEFNLSYGQAKSVVDGLVAEGGLVYLSGVQYRLAEPPRGITRGAPLFRYVDDDDFVPDSLFDDDDDDDEDLDLDDEDDEEDEEDDIDTRFAEYERILRECTENDEENDEEEEDEEEEDENAKNGEENGGEDSDGLAEYIMKSERLLCRRKEAAQKLVDILSSVREVKSAPVTPYREPDASLWTDAGELADAVSERLNRLIKSDENISLRGAVDKAECWLEAVRDTHDRKMVQIYEWLVYELKGHDEITFEYLKKLL